MSEARSRRPRNIEELRDAMDAEDEELRQAAFATRSGRKYGRMQKKAAAKKGRRVKKKESVTKKEESVKEEIPDEESDLSEDELEAIDREWKELLESIRLASLNKKTRHNYHLSLSRFVLYLFGKQSSKKAKSEVKQRGSSDFHILHDKLLDELKTVKDGKGKEKRMRNIAMEHLKKASADYHPISVENLTPDVFVGFLLSLTNSKEDEFLKSYGSHRSALTLLFTNCEVTPSSQFKQNLARFMKGLKNKAATARGEKGSRLNEGKDPLPFEVYRAICKWLLEEGSAESVFGHCFLTITWNLMCRSRNTVLVRKEHINWSNDSMYIQFAHEKSQMEGQDAGHKRHIFANPEIPEICPILSLGRYFLTFPGSDSGYLFSGSSQYDRFRKLLSRIVTEHADEIRRLGIDPKNIGVHSIRKGAATYCCNGTPTGVAFAAVCIRAGWTMGGVKDRYLQYQEAGDQVCGRTVAGLDVNSHRFSVSPPFFDVPCENANIAKMIDATITTVFGPVQLQWMLLSRYLLASLVLHFNFMSDVIKGESRFRKSILFRRGLLDGLFEWTKTCFPWNNPSTLWRITFTGLPQSVIDFNYHVEQLTELRAFPDKIVSAIVVELDKRQIGGGDLSIDRLRKELFDPFQAKIEARLDTFEGKTASGPVGSTAKKPDPISLSTSQFRSIPTDYQLNTKLSLQDAWICWHLGEELKVKGKKEVSTGKDGKESKAIHYTSPPWKLLKNCDLRKTETQRGYLYNLNFLCKKMDSAVGLSIMSKPSLNDLTDHFKSENIRTMLLPILTTKKGRQRRVDQINWDSAARELRKASSQKRKAELESGPSSKFRKVEQSRVKLETTKPSSAMPKDKSKKVKPEPLHQEKNDDDDDSIMDVYCHRMPAPKEKRKRKRKRSSSSSSIKVNGPIPAEPDEGHLAVTVDDCNVINIQGRMLNGTCTTAYLNVLAREHYAAGTRRTRDDFVPTIVRLRGQHGSGGFWNAFVEENLGTLFGDHLIDWEDDRLIFLQIFRGSIDCGHWALAVVDRTHSRDGAIVLFDSMPELYSDTLDHLQQILQGTPLCSEGTRWIRASMPIQGPATLDCGVWMCVMASLYVKGLLECGLLSSSEAGHDFTSVKVDLAAHTDPTTFGGLARGHMLGTISNGLCDLKCALFRYLSIHWS